MELAGNDEEGARNKDQEFGDSWESEKGKGCLPRTEKVAATLWNR